MAEKENESAGKKRQLSLSLKANRFKKVSKVDLSGARKGFVPDNTARSNRWAIGNFETWLNCHRDSNEKSTFEDDVLLTDDSQLLCSCLCTYVMETRKENGDPYPPKTIYNLLAGVQRYMRENKSTVFNIMDTKEPDFRPLHNTIDYFFRKLHSEGVGTNPQQSAIISHGEEELLWSTGVMGTSNPKQLLHAVFFYCGLNLCLRGGNEHRALKFSQFNCLDVPNPDSPTVSTVCYQYTEHGSKNNLGSIKQVRKRQPNKVIRHFANSKLGDKCLVRLLDLYFSKRPKFKSESGDSDAFYLRPVDTFDSSAQDSQWYYARPIGHNTQRDAEINV